MKKVIKNIKKSVLMVVMFTALLSYANNTPYLIEKKDVKKTSFTLKNVKEGELLSIKDNNGLILYKEIIKKTGTYSKAFDLTELPDGNYFFELDKDLEIKTIPFRVTSKEVVFNKGMETTIFKPFARVKNNLVFVSKLSLNHEPLEISIFYENPYFNDGYEMIFSEKIENVKFIERVYRLSEKVRGNYKIIFKTENRKFTKHINI